MMLRQTVTARATITLKLATAILLRRPTGVERSDWLWRLRTATGTKLTTRLVISMVW